MEEMGKVEKKKNEDRRGSGYDDDPVKYIYLIKLNYWGVPLQRGSFEA